MNVCVWVYYIICSLVSPLRRGSQLGVVIICHTWAVYVACSSNEVVREPEFSASGGKTPTSFFVDKKMLLT